MRLDAQAAVVYLRELASRIESGEITMDSLVIDYEIREAREWQTNNPVRLCRTGDVETVVRYNDPTVATT